MTARTLVGRCHERFGRVPTQPAEAEKGPKVPRSRRTTPGGGSAGASGDPRGGRGGLRREGDARRSGPRASSPRASASSCCSTPRGVSSRWSRCAGTGPPGSAWRRSVPTPTASSPGWGLVHGRTVFVYAHDFRIFGGALGEAHAQPRSTRSWTWAISAGCPAGLAQRRCRGPDPGGRLGARRVRRHLPAQHPRRPGVIPQISRDAGPARGLRRLLTRR